MAYLRASAAQADRIAKRFANHSPSTAAPSFAYVRDFCDAETGSEMTCYQLDLLTDMVMRRLPQTA